MIKIIDKLYFLIGVLDILSSIFAYYVFNQRGLENIAPLSIFVMFGGIVLVISSIKFNKKKEG